MHGCAPLHLAAGRRPAHKHCRAACELVCPSCTSILERLQNAPVLRTAEQQATPQFKQLTTVLPCPMAALRAQCWHMYTTAAMCPPDLLAVNCLVDYRLGLKVADWSRLSLQVLAVASFCLYVSRCGWACLVCSLG